MRRLQRRICVGFRGSPIATSVSGALAKAEGDASGASEFVLRRVHAVEPCDDGLRTARSSAEISDTLRQVES